MALQSFQLTKKERNNCCKFDEKDKCNIKIVLNWNEMEIRLFNTLCIVIVVHI